MDCSIPTGWSIQLVDEMGTGMLAWENDGVSFTLGCQSRLVTPRLDIAQGTKISFSALAENDVPLASWKSVTVEYSVDGVNWTTAETVTTTYNEWKDFSVSYIPAGNYFIAFQAKNNRICEFSGGTLAYKAPAPTSIDGNGIANVTFGTGASVVNNNERPTSAPFYGNYVNKVGTAEIGQRVDLDITFETGCSYGTLVWVDWNRNYNFDEDELVCKAQSRTSSPTTLQLSFDVPLTQETGDYVMRICAADVWMALIFPEEVTMILYTLICGTLLTTWA